MLFTYVRDPIDRFISGFYEMKRRNNGMKDNMNGNKTEDLNEMRALLSSMMRLKQKNAFIWRMDQHLWPQMLFLVDQYGKLLDFNYIGMLENIEVTLPLIFEQYEHIPSQLVTDYLSNNIYHDSRSRTFDETYASYGHYLTRADINEDDESLIR